MQANEQILSYLTRVTTGSASLQLALGYLIGNKNRVTFVKNLETAVVGMIISVHRRIEVPTVPWQGVIADTTVADPLTWILTVSEHYSATNIAVRIATDDMALVQKLEPLLQSEVAASERRWTLEKMGKIREELDSTLDLYNEMRNLLEVDQSRSHELEKFLQLAETQMKSLGEGLKELKTRHASL